MALTDNIRKHERSNHNDFRCTVPEVLSQLSKTDQDAFLEHLARNKSINVLCVALREEGYKISEKKVSAHRNGTCLCVKEK